MSSILYDVRYALRSMARRPLFSLVLVSILALGLGANAAMFSVVDSVLLEPLPYPEADQLVWVRSLTPDGNPNSVAAEDWRLPAGASAHSPTLFTRRYHRLQPQDQQPPSAATYCINR